MEEKKNEVLEDIQMNEQENEAPVAQTEVQEATITVEEKKDDSVTLFGKTIPKKPLIIASAIAAAAIALTVTLILIFAKHPITKFFAKMEKEDSYQMAITLSDIPFFGTITMQTKQDGNISYTAGFGEETYTEKIGDDVYEYTKDSSGNWIKEKQESEDEDESDSTDITDDFEELLNPKNYDKVEKNKYEQKDDVHFDDYDNVIITLDDGTCTLEMDIISDGMVMHAKIVISKLGEIELVLPKV